MKYIKFPKKIPFMGTWFMATILWPQKNSKDLEMHLKDAMEYMKFQKKFHYLADGSFTVRFFFQNSILVKLIKICVGDFYKTLHDDL